MPDWTAPFHAPTMSDEKFAAQKAEYVAKNGYTITIPGLSDIIKIRTHEPMTKQEHKWWRARKYEMFSPLRFDQLKKDKAKRREKYLAMLASPTPAVVQNAGSIMCAIDDAQDAASTLACIGQIARSVAPKVLGKLLKGPTGLLLMTSDLLNMVQQSGQFCMAPMYGKKAGEELARASPKNYKGRLKKRLNTSKKLPTQADWIQGLQTTDQVFGYGICLGPIVGLMQDIVFGAVRSTPGKFVDIKFPIPDFQSWYKTAQKAAKAVGALFGAPFETDDEDILLWIASAQLAFQQLFVINQQWNPLETVSSMEDLEVAALEPDHTLTIEVIQEGPVDLDKVIGWPQNNKRWISLTELADRTQETATNNMTDFLKRNKYSWTGYVGGLCATQTAMYAMACLEGEDDVAYDHSMQLKAATTMLKHGYFLNPNQPMEKFLLFQAFLDDCERTLWNPTIEDIKDFCHAPWNNIRLNTISARFI